MTIKAYSHPYTPTLQAKVDAILRANPDVTAWEILNRLESSKQRKPHYSVMLKS